MKTSKMLNRIAAKMKETNQLHKNDKVELCESKSIFTSEIHSVYGLNNRYISQSEYEQLVAFQAYLREQKEVDVEKLTKYILGSREKNLRFIKSVLETIPDLIPRLLLKNQESDIRGFAIEYIARTQIPSKQKRGESEDFDEEDECEDEEDLEDEDSYDDEEFEEEDEDDCNDCVD